MYRRIVLLVTMIVLIVFLSVNVSFNNAYESTDITVEVKGQVKNEEVINMPVGSSFEDLLERIELDDNADISGFSRQSILYNKQVIVIPKVKEYELISINSASIEQLCTLPGIGKTMAQRIINYRENYGCFNSLEDIKNVSGIGDKKYEKIKEYITL